MSIKHLLAATAAVLLLVVSCVAPKVETQIEDNIKKYVSVWDEIINKGNLDLFNEENFTPNILVHAVPQNMIGISDVRAFYANYVTGFSDIQFTVNDCFGQDDKLVKHWTFKGTHTGDFFGIPATGKSVSVEGVTLVRMDGGKIAEEQDFFDNLEFMQQLGLIPR